MARTTTRAEYLSTAYIFVLVLMSFLRSLPVSSLMTSLDAELLQLNLIYQASAGDELTHPVLVFLD